MNLADAPTTWPDPPPMSTLEALLIFVGIPLLVIAGVSLLVMAPSLAKGPRYRPTEDWEAESEWFGALPGTEQPSAGGQALEAGTTSTDTGGASARW